jgi:hypothetical protein
MVARLCSPTRWVGSGAWLILMGCPQLLTDDFRTGLREAGSIESKFDASVLQSGPNGSGGTAGAARRGRVDAGFEPSGAAGTGALTISELGLLPTLRAALAHRYDFDGTDNTAVDAVAGANGYIYNDVLAGQGFIRLTGSDQYVSLPNGLLSSGTDRTIEAWLIWRGGDRWQRIFDFGSSDKGELLQGGGRSYLFLTARGDTDTLLAAFSLNGIGGEIRVSGTRAMPVNQLTQLAVVVDGGHDTLSLFVNGALESSAPLTQPLSSILDNNMWIGRSQFVSDPGLNGDVTEFRIYNQALTAAQLALSAKLGPEDPLTRTP